MATIGNVVLAMLDQASEVPYATAHAMTTGQTICRELARCNGGPGLTADELAERLGCPRAVIRQEMAGLVLRQKVCTIDRAGRYKVGVPPVSLFEVS